MTSQTSNLNRRLPVLALLPLAILAGCAQTPTAPHVAVMPAHGKPFEVFAAEEKECRAYAQDAIGGENAADKGNERAVGSAALGTVIGAAAGTVLGGRHGTGEGAGMGLLFGSAVGAGQSGQTTQDLQRRYDIAYEQCMYAKGNQIPGAAQPARQHIIVQQPVYVTPAPQPVYVAPAPQPAYAPPPPSAAVPPPPPPPPGN